MHLSCTPKFTILQQKFAHISVAKSCNVWYLMHCWICEMCLLKAMCFTSHCIDVAHESHHVTSHRKFECLFVLFLRQFPANSKRNIKDPPYWHCLGESIGVGLISLTMTSDAKCVSVSWEMWDHPCLHRITFIGCFRWVCYCVTCNYIPQSIVNQSAH